MPYTIVKTTKNGKSGNKYLGFDEAGDHEWKNNRIDAIRFDSIQHAEECCHIFIKAGGQILAVDEYDGHYETHRDYEVQVFKDDEKSIPGGKRWRFRIGPIMKDRPFEYSPGNKGYTSFDNAMRAAKSTVDKRPRVTQLV